MKQYQELTVKEVAKYTDGTFVPTHRKVSVWYNGERKSVVVNFSIVEKKDLVESNMLFADGNYDYTVMTFTRKSAKKIAMVENFVEDNINEIFTLSKEGKKPELVQLLNLCNQ